MVAEPLEFFTVHSYTPWSSNCVLSMRRLPPANLEKRSPICLGTPSFFHVYSSTVGTGYPSAIHCSLLVSPCFTVMLNALFRILGGEICCSRKKDNQVDCCFVAYFKISGVIFFYTFSCYHSRKERNDLKKK